MSANQYETYKISIQSNASPQITSSKTSLHKALSVNYLAVPLKGNPKALPQTMKSLNSINKDVSNIQSRAIKHFFEKQIDENEDNFSSCFYLNSYRNFDNQRVFEMKQIIDKYSKEDAVASDLAKELFQKFFRNRFQQTQTIQKSMDNVQFRASSQTNQKKHNKQTESLKHYCEFSQKNAVKKLYSNLKQISEHILNQEGETKFERLNQKLQDKESATIEQLKEQTLDQNDKVLQNLRLLRILLSKKTDEYEILKEIEQSLKFESENGDNTNNNNNNNTNFSELKDSDSQEIQTLVSTQTRISKFKEEMKSKKKKEEQKKIEKYLNIDELKSRWHQSDEFKIKQTMHRSLVRETLSLEERRKIQHGDQKITTQQQLAKATIKKGISQFAISIEQLKAAQEQEKQKKLVKPLIKQQQKLRQVQNFFNKLELVGQEQPVEQKVKKSKSSMQSVNELRQKMQKSEKEVKAKSDFFKCKEEQGSSQFTEKTMRYSNLFMKQVEQNSK